MNDLLKKKNQELEEARKEMVAIGQQFHFFNDNQELTVFDDMLSQNPSDIGNYLYKKILRENDTADFHRFLVSIDKYCKLKAETERYKDK